MRRAVPGNPRVIDEDINHTRIALGSIHRLPDLIRHRQVAAPDPNSRPVSLQLFSQRFQTFAVPIDQLQMTSFIGQLDRQLLADSRRGTRQKDSFSLQIAHSRIPP